jgi:hypothetical protein
MRTWVRLGIVLTVVFVGLGGTWLALTEIAQHVDYLNKTYDCTPHFPDCQGNLDTAIASTDRRAIFFRCYISMVIWAALAWIVAAFTVFAAKWVLAARNM